LHPVKSDDPISIIRATHLSGRQTETPAFRVVPVVIASVHEGPNELNSWLQLNRYDLVRSGIRPEELGQVIGHFELVP
jgi:hypothetical protein